jgi:hypothetical protein
MLWRCLEDDILWRTCNLTIICCGSMWSFRGVEKNGRLSRTAPTAPSWTVQKLGICRAQSISWGAVYFAVDIVVLLTYLNNVTFHTLSWWTSWRSHDSHGTPFSSLRHPSKTLRIRVASVVPEALKSSWLTLFWDLDYPRPTSSPKINGSCENLL